ncbi:MAG: DUF951 domain-containing protein [bacterium]
MEKINWQLGDLVKMRKQHPCGGFIWEILRIGMDFRLRCLNCGRIVLLPRQKFEKQVREKVEKQS